MKKNLLILNFLFFTFNFSHSQPAIQWQNTIGGDTADYLESIQQTSDGGYILGGYSKSSISADKTENTNGGYDYWLIKTDEFGNIQWQNTIGGNDDDFLLSVQQTADGGYVLGGFSYSNISGDKTENNVGAEDYWLVKTDASGNIQWQKTIGGSAYDRLYSIQQTEDGGYILGGSSNSNISGDKTENNWDTTLFTNDYWLVKTDASGNIQWQNTIGGNSGDDLYSIQQTADGGYIFGGFSFSNVSGDKTENRVGSVDYWIVKTDSAGNIQWQNTLGGSNDDYLRYLKQTADGGYILGGYSQSNISGDKTENNQGSYDYWVVKIDAVGNIHWQNTIGGSLVDQLYYVQQTVDGGYILGGGSVSNISGDKTEDCIGYPDYWIVKADSSGNIQWQNTIGGSNTEYFTSLLQTADGGYILSGWSNSNISGDKIENSNGSWDYWIVKLAPYVSIEEETDRITFNISPNPFSIQTTISFNKEVHNATLSLYNLLGEKVKEISGISRESFQFNRGNLPSGVYVFEVREKDKNIYRGKAVVH